MLAAPGRIACISLPTTSGIVGGKGMDSHERERLIVAEYRRVRSLPHYDVTPEWVLYHLMQQA